jgi:hypothetical protein
MKFSLWRLVSRQEAADILCGKSLTMLMHDGPYGYGLYLRPHPIIPDERRVGLQFEISEELARSHETGWEAVARLPLPNNDILIGDSVIDADGSEIVCVYNSNTLRLISIACC